MFIFLMDTRRAWIRDCLLAEFTYDFESQKVNSTSYRQVFRIGIPLADHPIKQIGFNVLAQKGDADYGLLYIAHGDVAVQSGPANAGQKNDPYGKILRINPLKSGESAYTIPSSNPFANDENMMDEVYALGFRNPHHFSFNKDSDGAVIMVGVDTGRDNIEEINIIEKGGNYGWGMREGTFVQLSSPGGLRTGIKALPDDEASNGFIYPAAQWIHEGQDGAGFVSQAIAGGAVISPAGTTKQLFVHAEFAKYGWIFHSDLDEMLDAVTKLDDKDANRDQPEELTQADIYEFIIEFDHDNNPSTPSRRVSGIKEIIESDPNYDFSDRCDLRLGRDTKGDLFITSKRNGWVYKVQSVKPEKAVEPPLASMQSQQWKVFPNPVKDGVLRISSGHTFTQFKIYSEAGMLLRAGKY